MTTFILNSLPNSIWTQKSTVTPITARQAKNKLSNEFVSFVGHESTAALYSQVLGVKVDCCRGRFSPQVGDRIVAGLFTPPRRLQEGEKWAEDEILSMPINWVLVQF